MLVIAVQKPRSLWCWSLSRPLRLADSLLGVYSTSIQPVEPLETWPVSPISWFSILSEKKQRKKNKKTMVLWCTGSMSVVVLGDSSEVSSDHNYDITPVKYWGKTLNCEGHRLQQCMIGVANVLHGWQLHCDRCFFFTNSFNLFEASWFLLAMFTSGDMLHSQQNMFCQINISPGLSSQRRGSSVSGCAKPPQPSKIDMLGSCGKNDFNTMGQHYLWPWR